METNSFKGNHTQEYPGNFPVPSVEKTQAKYRETGNIAKWGVFLTAAGVPACMLVSALVLYGDEVSRFVQAHLGK